MSTRKTAFLISSLTFVVILIVITVFLNFIVGRLPSSAARIDFTQNQEYTLSDATKRIVSRLDDLITVTYWVTEDMPSSLVSLRQDTVDYLEEIRLLSDGNIAIKVLDPEKEAKRIAAEKEKEKEERKKDLEGSDFKAEDKDDQFSFNQFGQDQKDKTEYQKQLEAMMRRGIRPDMSQVIENDKMEIAQFYSAIELTYKDRQPEVISNHKDMTKLEYEMASRILKVTIAEEDKAVVALFEGDPKMAMPDPRQPNMPPRPQSSYRHLQNDLRQFFKIESTRLTKDDPIPEKTKTLIVANPKNLNERQAYEINRFVSSGGRAIFLVGNYTVTMPGENPMMQGRQMPPMPAAITTGLEDVFRAWGVRFNPRPLNAKEHGIISMGSGGQIMGMNVKRMSPVPTHVLSLAEQFNQKNPIMKDLRVIICPWSTVLKLDADELLKEKKLEAEVLVTSSENTWFGKPSPAMVNDVFANGPDPLDRNAHKTFSWAGKQNLVVMLRGQFPFKWDGKDVPEWPKADDAADDGDDKKPEEKKAPPQKAALEAPKDSSIIIVGSPEFCNDKYIEWSEQYYSGNYFFLRNVVEIYSLSNDLLEIRNKQSPRRPFDQDVEPGTRTALKWINLLVLPLLIGLAGIGYAIMRVQRSNLYENTFNKSRPKENTEA